MKPTFSNKYMRLYKGDCLGILPSIKADALISDPPYGVNNNCDYTRFTYNGKQKPGKKHKQIKNDKTPFDPTHLLGFPKIALFGYQYFASSLPLGSILVWDKKSAAARGKWLSDAELAWFNSGVGCYIVQHTWMGKVRDSEANLRVHPTQKPVTIMRWLIDRQKLEVGSIIVDPYMGSGTTGVAAIEAGMRFIGIELETNWFNIAKKRIILAHERKKSGMGL